MSQAPKRPCAVATCFNLVDNGQYCQKHKKTALTRPNSNARGYGYDWRTFRAFYLARHPMCVDCHVKPATDVHHIEKLADRPDLKYTESNLMSLCHECHATRTANGE